MGLWKHSHRPVWFTLVVDDFGVKYIGKEHAEHLFRALKNYYNKVTIDWKGALYCGITLEWNYQEKWVNLSIPNYIDTLIRKFQYQPSKKLQYSPFPWNKPTYGESKKYPTPTDMSPTLDKKDIMRIQQIIGTFLYYERMVDPTLLVDLSDLETQQTKETQLTVKNMNQLLDYFCGFPNATIRYAQSDMVLKVHSDSGYLNVVGDKSRVGGYFYMGNKPCDNNDNNGGVLSNSTLLRNIMSSSSEAEYGELFIKSRLELPLRMALENLGHSQPPTPIFTDNMTERGLDNDSLKMGQSKFMDKRFH